MVEVVAEASKRRQHQARSCRAIATSPVWVNQVDLGRQRIQNADARPYRLPARVKGKGGNGVTVGAARCTQPRSLVRSGDVVDDRAGILCRPSCVVASKGRPDPLAAQLHAVAHPPKVQRQ